MCVCGGVVVVGQSSVVRRVREGRGGARTGAWWMLVLAWRPPQSPP